jgi:hypothetical protein
MQIKSLKKKALQIKYRNRKGKILHDTTVLLELDSPDSYIEIKYEANKNYQQHAEERNYKIFCDNCILNLMDYAKAFG